MQATLVLLVFVAKHKRSIVYLPNLRSAILDLKLNHAHQVEHGLTWV
jgi:hypothetical protein